MSAYMHVHVFAATTERGKNKNQEEMRRTVPLIHETTVLEVLVHILLRDTETIAILVAV